MGAARGESYGGSAKTTAKRAPAAARRVDRAGGVVAHDPRPVRETQALDIVAQGPQRLRVLLHEHGGGRAARQRLDAHAARAREEVEERAVLEVRHQGVQAGDAHLVGGGPCRPPLGRGQTLPLQRAGEHPHQPTLARSSSPAPAREQRRPQRAVLGPGEVGIRRHEGEGFLPRLLEERAVTPQIGHAKGGQAGLPGADEVAGAADAEIGLGDAEPVAGLLHGGEPAARVLRGALAHEDAVALPLPRPTRPRS